VGRVPTRAEYRAMVADAAAEAEDLAGLPSDTPRALNRLAGGQLGRKPQKLTRRKQLPRKHPPKPEIARRRPDGLAAWQALRELAYIRAGYRCERCGVHRDQAFGGVLDGHHRKLRSRGGKDELSNLAVLCRECHEWAHRNVLAATGLGYIVPSRADPAVRLMQLYGDRLTLLNETTEYDLIA
jgi:5-methylcytosine-specific restriction endonuclease McrA